jgi:asparagine synthase (glutamine-hydrolysing)
MCGIWALIEKNNIKTDISKYLADFWQLKHRGPDNSHFETFNQVYVGFHRLAIMDTSFAHRARSNQPYIFNDIDRTIVFICNGEIYNFQQLDKKYNLNVGTSDCMVIPKLYLLAKNNQEWFNIMKNELKGEYAFVMFEFDNMKQLTRYYAGRDMIGIRPLYTVDNSSKGHFNNDIDMFSSEIKGMSSFEGKVIEFEPGTIIMVEKTLSYYNTTKFDMKIDLYNTNYNYNNFSFYKSNCNNQIYYDTDINIILPKIRTAVINSVKRRLHADRPIAFLLSGGVDSSLVASISANILSETNGHIRTFCCGIKGSTDMIYAKKVAEHIGSNHTEVFFTEEEGLEAIDDVIRTTETWDITTIRASVGQYLVSKYISQHTDCKVVLVGEGPDEVCSSYLFNYYAPNGEELDKSSKEYVRDIHMYDGRRADRCVSRWGLEARIPLLDPEFINIYWGIEPTLRMPVTHSMEKFLFRKAFSDLNLLPNEVLWRKKEAFSDGVSSKERSWFQMIQEYINKQFETNDYKIPKEILDTHIPPTKESQYYLYKFIEYFGINRVSILPHYWQPKWTNKEGQKFIDPSARVLSIY